MRRKYPLCYNPFGDCYAKPCDDVHHIKPIATHPELAFDKDNLVTLCKQCHGTIEGMERRGEKTQFLFTDEKWVGVPKSLREKETLINRSDKYNSHDVFGGQGCKKISCNEVFCCRMKKIKLNFCGSCKNKLFKE